MKEASFSLLNFLAIGCFIILILPGCESRDKVESNPDPIATKNISSDEGVLFKRSNLVVSDIDRSLKIYDEILGFEPFSAIEESKPDSYSYPVFKIPKSAKIRFLVLNSSSQERTLALTEVTGIDLPRPGIPLMSAIVIRVDDLDTTMGKISDLGLETTEKKVVESKRVNYKEQAFIDFDGHLIVLYETF